MSLIADEDIDSILHEEFNNDSEIVDDVRIYDELPPQFEMNEAYNNSSSQNKSDDGAYGDSAFDAIVSTAQYIESGVETVVCKTDGVLNEVNLNLLDVGQEVTLMLDVVSSELIDNEQRGTNSFQEITPQGSKDKENLNMQDVVGSEFIDDEQQDVNNFQEITPQGSKDKEILSSDDMEISSSEESDSSIEKTRSRRRTVNKKNWKSEIRKKKRQHGKEYKDRKGNIHRGRTIQGDCRGNCKFKCAIKINQQSREKIHTKFWSLSETGRNHFYSKFVDRQTKKRSRVEGNENNRKFSYTYYLGTEHKDRARVCKEYFLKTLDISQRRIYYFFQCVYDVGTGVARSPLKGKNTKSHIEESRKESVRNHINSFPRVASHYCRVNSKKEYLESALTLAEMYRLYKEIVENPVTESLYRFIFNHEFNLEFHKPKKDRCDNCEAYKANIDPSEIEKNKYETHQTEKIAVKNTRDADRQHVKKALDDTGTCVVAFDLENVFPLPKAEVSNYFYKRKLNCYNLTAHAMFKGQTLLYCMVWHELISGRAGNHLASAVYRLLKDLLVSFPEIKKLVLWSDSCVPQNKNSIMTLALQNVMKETKSVEEVVQRFSEPGHGVVQEVDAIHSQIERWLKPIEVYSPLSLIRVLVRRAEKNNTAMKIIQMKPNDFMDFQSLSKTMKFSEVPYTKVKEIRLKSDNLFMIEYRTTFSSDQSTLCSILRESPRTPGRQPKIKRKSTLTTINNKMQEDGNGQSSTTTAPVIPTPIRITTSPIIPLEKKKDIQSMIKYMPEVDKQFYCALFKM